MTSRRPTEKQAIERWDRVFTSLSAEPRRQIIVALNDVPADNRVLLPEAALSPTMQPDREQFVLELCHHHLPHLEDYGFIEWTKEPFRAGRGPRFEEAAIVLKLLQENATRIPDSLVHGCPRLEAERSGTSG